MARQQKTDTLIADDLTGDILSEEEEVQTVLFTIDGTTYELDLSQDSVSLLRRDLLAWIEHTRTVTRPTTAGPTTPGKRTAP